MAYVEFLRVRKSLLWHAGIIVAVAIVIMLIGSANMATEVSVNGTSRSADAMIAGTPVPLSVVAGVAAFFGLIFASTCGISLNRESATRDLSWTKPVSRTLLALQFALVDIGAVIVAYFVAFAAILAIMLRYHVAPFADGPFPEELLLGIGIGTMWYALLQLITCMFGPGARAMAGLLWPITIVLAALSHLGAPYGSIARVLNYINPLAYLSSTESDVHQHVVHVTASANTLPTEAKLVLVWLFSVIFTAIAIALWPKKEA